MTADELEIRLQAALVHEPDLLRLRALLVSYRDAGGSQSELIARLERMRAAVAHEPLREDRVLDLLDFATGFCGPHLRLW